MKKIIFILSIFVFILLILMEVFYKNIDSKEEVTGVLEYRNGIAFLPSENKPFTGRFEVFYSNADDHYNLMTRTNYSLYRESNVELERNPEIDLKTHTEGVIENGLEKLWHKIVKRQKAFEENYKDGKLNGLAISWDENRDKTSEINYKDGKLNGLSTIWYKNGHKISKNFNGILTSDLSKEQISAATEKMTKRYDEIEGMTWYEDKSTTYLETSIYLYIGKDKNVNLRLKAMYLGYDWVFAESFIVVADGQRFEKLNAEFQRNNKYDKVWEIYDKPVFGDDLVMIKAIIESGDATIRFKGRQTYEDHRITQQEKESMKNVLDAFEALGGHVEFRTW